MSEQMASSETHIIIDTSETDHNVLPPEKDPAFSMSRLLGQPVQEMAPLDIGNGVFKITMEGESREIFLRDREDTELFERMRIWKTKNTNATVWDMIDAFEKEKEDGADAYAKVLYDYPFPDFILKYENSSEENEEKDEKDIAKERSRQNFEGLLILAGLVVEREPDINGKNTYVKLYVPFMRMCKEAEHMKIKMRLDVSSLPELEIRNTYPKTLSFIKHFTRQIDLKKESALFKEDRLRQFDGAERDRPWSDIVKDFWDGAKRSLLTHHIIINANQIYKETVVDGTTMQTKQRIRPLAIKKLLANNVYSDFFPLHDGPAEPKEGEPQNLRAELYDLWFKQWKKPQPLEKVRQYFGEKLAIYFAFLGFYTLWLSVASVIGLLVIIFGIIEACRGVDYETGLSISPLWDNALSAPFAFFMSVWATCFLETWKRYNISLQYDWDVLEFEKEEQPRPEFYGTIIRKSPITHKKELHVPYRQRMKRFLVSIGVVGISICIVIVVIGALLTFSRRLLGTGIGGNIISACLNLAIILILSLVYSKSAIWLTDFENHKTATRYEDSLILKTFCFDFINNYSALFFIILFKNKIAESFTDSDKYKCQYGGNCLTELTIQLAIILVGKQAIGQFQELVVPRIKSKMRKQVLLAELDDLREKYKSDSQRMLHDVPQWAKDDKLAPLEDQYSSEYGEMVLQFGFISLFTVAFPFAPLFAWLNNITEIRFDAMKYLKTFQRSVGFQAQDIGMWELLMNGVSLLAVLTNAGIIAFQSKWMEHNLRNTLRNRNNDDELHTKQLIFMFCFEHGVFLIKLAFAYLISDVPKPVRVAIEREQYMARLALEKDDPATDDVPEEDSSFDNLFNARGSLRIRKLKENTKRIGHEFKHEGKMLVGQDADTIKHKVKEETGLLVEHVKGSSQKMLGRFSFQRHDDEESLDKPKEG